MTRVILSITFGITAAWVAQGQNVEAEPTKPDVEFALSGFTVPPGFFSGVSGGKQDPKQFLEKSGVAFPAGSEVHFDSKSSTLFVRNTTDNISLLEFLFDGLDCMGTTQIVVELQTFECQWPTSQAASAIPDMAFLKSLPESDVVPLDRVAVMTRSGIMTTTQSKNLHSSGARGVTSLKKLPKDALAFAPDEFGTEVTAESVVGPDGRSIETNIHYRSRRPASGERAGHELAFGGTFQSTDGHPFIVHSSPLAKTSEKFLVVVATARQVDFAGRRIPEPDESED